MKTPLEHIKEITGDFRAYRATVTVSDILKIQSDAIEHAASILFDDHWNDNETAEAYTHLLNEAKTLKASAEPSNKQIT